MTLIEVLSLYKWTLVASLFCGAALALIGSQLAARNQAVQTFVVSQGAALGIVVGIVLQLPPIFSAFVFSAAILSLCERSLKNRLEFRNTYYVGIFAVLMAITYTLISMAPGLESHMATSYFGDVALAGVLDCQIVLALSVVSLIGILVKWPQILKVSFDRAVFGASSRNVRSFDFIFSMLALLMISTSIQFLGLLFTISCLFLPVMVLSTSRWPAFGFKWVLLGASLVGVGIGFFVSVMEEKIPTSPSITLCLLFSAIALTWARRMYEMSRS